MEMRIAKKVNGGVRRATIEVVEIVDPVVILKEVRKWTCREATESIIRIHDMATSAVRRVKEAKGCWGRLDVGAPLLVLRMKPCGGEF